MDQPISENKNTIDNKYNKFERPAEKVSLPNTNTIINDNRENTTAPKPNEKELLLTSEDSYLNDVSKGNQISILCDTDDFKSAGINKPKHSNNIVTKDKSTLKQTSISDMKKLKKSKKSIFISYSSDAGYCEKKFIVETVRQLKENNLSEDIWFDKDEKIVDSPCWFSLCMETLEKCKAAILFLSDSYFTCPVSLYGGKALLERISYNPSSVKIFPVLFSQPDAINLPKQFVEIMNVAIDLTGDHATKSIAEKTSVVIGCIMEDLEKLATLHSAPHSVTPFDLEFTGEFKKKKICLWNVSDLQEWLFSLGIKEFYRQSLAEAGVDGFLLMSITDHDMNTFLGIESRVVRKKIMQQILHTLDTEHKRFDNWHLRLRAHRTKPDSVYLIYDPADVRLAQNLKSDLKAKSLQVSHHNTTRLGNSKEEFLEVNGPLIATSSHVIVFMTQEASISPFVFQEVLFADWLGKKIVTAMFNNVWCSLRASMKAILGDYPAVDFESRMYSESLEILEHQIKPLRRVPGVVLEQTYLTKMSEGSKPLKVLVNSRNQANSSTLGATHPSSGQLILTRGKTSTQYPESCAQVFISYQWDMQTKVDEIQQILERAGFICWADVSMAADSRRHSSSSVRSSVSIPYGGPSAETLQSQIHRTMKACRAVVCFITPKYLQSDNCAKDLSLADAFQKPIIPLLLRYVPLESMKTFVGRILLRYGYIDLSNDRLYKQKIGVLVDRVRKTLSQ